MQTKHPTVEELLERINKIRHLPLNGNTFYRDAPVASHALYGTGPLQGLDRGARYSPPGKFPVLYFGTDRLQSQLEAAHHFNRLRPMDTGDEIRLLHSSLTSLQAEKLHKILQDMAASEQGYVENQEIVEYLNIQHVNKLFQEDPARLQVFLEMAPYLTTPLRKTMDTARINIAVQITARGVLDLTDRAILGALKIDHSELVTATDFWQKSSEEN